MSRLLMLFPNRASAAKNKWRDFLLRAKSINCMFVLMDTYWFIDAMRWVKCIMKQLIYISLLTHVHFDICNAKIDILCSIPEDFTAIHIFLSSKHLIMIWLYWQGHTGAYYMINKLIMQSRVSISEQCQIYASMTKIKAMNLLIKLDVIVLYPW